MSASPPRPLKLVLKVSGASSSTTTYQQVTSSPASSDHHHHYHNHHNNDTGLMEHHQTIPPLNINLKKKKKKKKHKHKHHHHHHKHHHHHHKKSHDQDQATNLLGQQPLDQQEPSYLLNQSIVEEFGIQPLPAQEPPQDQDQQPFAQELQEQPEQPEQPEQLEQQSPLSQQPPDNTEDQKQHSPPHQVQEQEQRQPSPPQLSLEQDQQQPSPQKQPEEQKESSPCQQPSEPQPPSIEDATEIPNTTSLPQSAVLADGLTAYQIIQQAKQAAKHVATTIRETRKNGVHLSYLRQQPDGSISLAILGSAVPTEEGEPAICGIEGDYYQEKVINLETLCGKLVDGLEVLPSQVDDPDEIEESKVKPIELVESTAYSSYLPAKDSTFANLTEEDSKILLAVYGNDPVGFDYAKSLQEFAHGNDYVMNMVDSLLDLLTNGKHREEVVPIRSRAMEAANKASQVTDTQLNNNINSNNNNNKESSNDEENEKKDELQAELDEVSDLLHQLQEIQQRRLSSSAAPVKKSEEETSLANMISSKLTKFIGSHTSPSDVCDSQSVFKALGIDLELDDLEMEPQTQ